jgi:hypothetical protein
VRIVLVLSVLWALATSAQAHRPDHPRFGVGGGDAPGVSSLGDGSSSATARSDSDSDTDILMLGTAIGADACANGAQGGGGGWGLSVSRMAAICELAMQIEQARVAGTEARGFADQHRRVCDKTAKDCDVYAIDYWDKRADEYWHQRFELANEVLRLHRKEHWFWTGFLFIPRTVGKVLGALVSF